MTKMTLSAILALSSLVACNGTQLVQGDKKGADATTPDTQKPAQSPADDASLQRNDGTVEPASIGGAYLVACGEYNPNGQANTDNTMNVGCGVYDRNTHRHATVAQTDWQVHNNDGSALTGTNKQDQSPRNSLGVVFTHVANRNNVNVSASFVGGDNVKYSLVKHLDRLDRLNEFGVSLDGAVRFVKSWQFSFDKEKAAAAAALAAAGGQPQVAQASLLALLSNGQINPSQVNSICDPSRLETPVAANIVARSITDLCFRDATPLVGTSCYLAKVHYAVGDNAGQDGYIGIPTKVLSPDTGYSDAEVLNLINTHACL